MPRMPRHSASCATVISRRRTRFQTCTSRRIRGCRRALRWAERSRKTSTFYFFGTEITRREESGFTNIGAGNFGLANTDVSRFFGAPTGAIVIQATPDQQAFFSATPSAAGASTAFQSYLGAVASSSSIALTGKNPAFLQGTFGPTGFASSGQPTPASFVALNSLPGNFPVQEKTEIYSLRIDHKLSDKHQLLLRGTASPSYITGIQENASNQNYGQNSGSRTARAEGARLVDPGPRYVPDQRQQGERGEVPVCAAPGGVQQPEHVCGQPGSGQHPGLCVLRQDRRLPTCGGLKTSRNSRTTLPIRWAVTR